MSPATSSLQSAAPRTLRRGREQAEYWRWVWAYRRRSLPDVMRALSSEAPRAKLYVLRNPAAVRRFAAEAQQRPDRPGDVPG